MPDLHKPFVAALMLTRDRPEFAERARRCFAEQTFPGPLAVLFELDNSAATWRGMSFGSLRNHAVRQIVRDLDCKDLIIIHWDDDDYHAPDRIERQVAQLLVSDKPCVGLHSGLFYETITGECWQYKSTDRNYTFGASLCYWASAWQRTPFPTDSSSSDEQWSEIVGRAGFQWRDEFISEEHLQQFGLVEAPGQWNTNPAYRRLEPFMICEVHGRNHGTQIKKDAEAGQWTRMPEWDQWCAARLTQSSSPAPLHS